ncbi:1,4-beta-xylanase [Saccharothrix sp. NRRL B-16348]|uniref:endo-1,4-beta-xylanase n=1 Tax=Saccharothrix sp. NRRL B-16348 TaxID=1415542 RepID=UPI0006AD8E91|nr:endo-1,4-beta-xylanase [Saccharothrix sp. NRRL B-16348]KOX31093.1 1,4-beta-xylanase [Saccharothrix sp. NRRL B-16348]
MPDGPPVPVTGSAVAPVAAAEPPLRQLAARHDLDLGTAVNLTALADDDVYREWVATQFDSVTAENEMKWAELEPTRGQHDWDRADELIAFARANRQTVRGHTLVWHNQNPAWLADLPADELGAVLKDHVQTTVRRFRGEIRQWDVVNEAVEEDGSLRDTVWLRALGPGYIADAFRWAHEADPDALLFYNDYDVEDVNAKSDGVYDLVQELTRQDVPIHGVGVQAHCSVERAPRTLRENLGRFADLGLHTALTEVDVRMAMPADPVKLEAQANVYRSLLRACLLTPGCLSFTVWGYMDKYSWVPGWFEGEGAADILDENFAAKPAHRALRDDLSFGGPSRRD